MCSLAGGSLHVMQTADRQSVVAVIVVQHLEVRGPFRRNHDESGNAWITRPFGDEAQDSPPRW